MSTPYRMVMTTCDSQDNARHIAAHLVLNKLAACVNILPKIESIYMWQGKVTQDEEVKLLVKTTSALVSNVIDAIQAEHSYDVPEVQVIEVTDGSQQYFNWMEEVLN
ncbi:divalent-cation tolerance protein CutA [Pseudoalteromonas luteoviolacea]|nr:divalent-cation tolerance protein CutA [Pseudoalteromonas luteoviolacea]AOT06699.1 cation tolerance protein CutA [Pseudoalteromonas luteoviolacea]AOT11617.1 cation tolerance protein CutA [Pseudoalteromonas luteoviolacea]AOT16529.1 cation tolerance protein CutA [Pseudoalteromonas luteoviolacea]